MIVDEIFMECDSDWEVILPQCLSILHEKPVLFVRVDCPLDELENRECARGDREIGGAREQYNEVHKNHIYDLSVDTYQHTPDECADIIIDKLNYINECTAFKSMYDKLSD